MSEKDRNLPERIRRPQKGGGQELDPHAGSGPPTPPTLFGFLMLSPGGWVQSLAWHPLKPWLAAAQRDAIVIWDTTVGAVVRILTGHSDAVTSVAWSPNGDRIV